MQERKRYARTFFRAAGTTLNEKDHEKLDIGILMALRQIKDGDLSDRPRLEICYVLCAGDQRHVRIGASQVFAGHF